MSPQADVVVNHASQHPGHQVGRVEEAQRRAVNLTLAAGGQTKAATVSTEQREASEMEGVMAHTWTNPRCPTAMQFWGT